MIKLGKVSVETRSFKGWTPEEFINEPWTEA